jgi:hypothetical protein
MRDENEMRIRMRHENNVPTWFGPSWHDISANLIVRQNFIGCAWAPSTSSPGAVRTRSQQKSRSDCSKRLFSPKYSRQRPTLPWSCPHSTIGGIRLNFRVRNGNGCDPDPMTTGKLAAWGSSSARVASYGATNSSGAWRAEAP